jgi:amidase
MPSSRRHFLTSGLGLAAAAALPSALRAQHSDAPRVPDDASWQLPPADDRSVAELQRDLARGALTSVALVEQLFARMDAIDRAGPSIRAVIERNPDALSIARERDAERAQGRVRGPLHGIPVLVKDNVDTADRMRTSAGSLLLAESVAPRDAHIVERLRTAGAIIIAKANLSEWANFRSTKSSSGWSARGGQTRNPYVLDRSPCGSSSGTGSGVSAALAPLGIGTETDGSIICPSAINGLVGHKPTIGLVGRSGIIPISPSQDTAGPMARSVADAYALLLAIAGPDPRDPVTARARALPADPVFRPDALKGVRIGVVQNLAGFSSSVDALFKDAVAALRGVGAEPIDVTLPTAGKYGDAEYEVLLYEFKASLAAYFATLGAAAPARTLADAIAFNSREASRELRYFGQEIFELAQQKGPLTDAAYRKARASCLALTRTQGIDRALKTHQVRALVYPSNGPAWPIDLVNGDRFTGGDSSFAAVSGYPSLTVPMGQVQGLPIGLSFTGTAWSDAELYGYAFAFEQATRHRRAPTFRPTIAAE